MGPTNYRLQRAGRTLVTAACDLPEIQVLDAAGIDCEAGNRPAVVSVEVDISSTPAKVIISVRE